MTDSQVRGDGGRPILVRSQDQVPVVPSSSAERTGVSVAARMIPKAISSAKAKARRTPSARPMGPLAATLTTNETASPGASQGTLLTATGARRWLV